ncbi:hypothetical protein HDU78_008879 [Chytriomyces hyalinus]|nr:hypothetical protein HDU78_008879 [Chytriomyces hyalinus]
MAALILLTMRVLIVGSGTFGISTALSLKQRGHDVTVFERLPIPSEDSSSNDITKVIRPDYGDDAQYMGGQMYQGLVIEAIKRFRQIDQETVKRYGKKSFIECGVVFATLKEDMNPYEMSSYKALLKTEEYKSAMELLNHEKTTKLLGKDFADQYPNGYINRSAGYADSGLVITHYAQLAKEAGINFVIGKEAGLFSNYISKDGKVVGIRTGDGKSHYGDAVLIAAGSWTPSLVPELKGLCEPTGQPVIHFKIPDDQKGKYIPSKFPVWFADMAQTGFYGFPLTPASELKFAHHGAGYLSTFHTRTAPSMKTASSAVITSKSVPREAVVMYRTFLGKFFPTLNKLDISRTRLCWYCDAWDGNFYIDAVPGRSGLFVATGGSGHAFKFTPVIGDIVADVIEGKANRYHQTLFKWRTPTQEERAKVDNLKTEYEKNAKVLESMIMADGDDLKAETFLTGKLQKKPVQLPAGKL